MIYIFSSCVIFATSCLFETIFKTSPKCVALYTVLWYNQLRIFLMCGLKIVHGFSHHCKWTNCFHILSLKTEIQLKINDSTNDHFVNKKILTNTLLSESFKYRLKGNNQLESGKKAFTNKNDYIVLQYHGMF